MTWYLLLVICSAVVLLAIATAAFLRGLVDGDSTEGEPTHGGLTLLAYHLGRRARLHREARIRTAITPKGRR